MSENSRTLEYWMVVTDKHEYKVSAKELEAIMKSESLGSRFVRLEDVVLNVAFIKEIYRKRRAFNTQYTVVPKHEVKYLVAEDKLMLD